MDEDNKKKAGIGLAAVAGLLLLAGIITGRLGLAIAAAPFVLMVAAGMRKK